MELFEKIVQRTTEKLYEDERLRSNMNDDESRIVLGWAERWLATQISAAEDEASARKIAQDEFTRVRQTVGAINALAAKPGVPRLSEAVAALETQAQATRMRSREEVFKLLTELTSTMWRIWQEPMAEGRTSEEQMTEE